MKMIEKWTEDRLVGYKVRHILSDENNRLKRIAGTILLQLVSRKCNCFERNHYRKCIENVVNDRKLSISAVMYCYTQWKHS